MPFFLVIAAAAGAAHYRRRREEGDGSNNGADGEDVPDDDDGDTPSDNDYTEDHESSILTTLDGNEDETGAEHSKNSDGCENCDEATKTNGLCLVTAMTLSSKNETCNDGTASRQSDDPTKTSNSQCTPHASSGNDRQNDEDLAVLAAESTESESYNPLEVDRMGNNKEHHCKHNKMDSGHCNRRELRRKVRRYFHGGRDDQEKCGHWNGEQSCRGDYSSTLESSQIEHNKQNALPSMIQNLAKNSKTLDRVVTAATDAANHFKRRRGGDGAAGKAPMFGKEESSDDFVESERGEFTCEKNRRSGNDGSENIHRDGSGGGDIDDDDSNASNPKRVKGPIHFVVSTAVHHFQQRHEKLESMDGSELVKGESSECAHSEETASKAKIGVLNCVDAATTDQTSKENVITPCEREICIDVEPLPNVSQTAVTIIDDRVDIDSESKSKVIATDDTCDDDGDSDGNNGNSNNGKIFDENEFKTSKQQRDQHGPIILAISAAVNHFQRQHEKRNSINDETPTNVDSIRQSEVGGEAALKDTVGTDDNTESHSSVDTAGQSTELIAESKVDFKNANCSKGTSGISPDNIAERETRSTEGNNKSKGVIDDGANAVDPQTQHHGPIQSVVSAAVGAVTQFQRRRENQKRRQYDESLTKTESSNSVNNGTGNEIVEERSSVVFTNGEIRAASQRGESEKVLGKEKDAHDAVSLTAGNRDGMKNKSETVATHAGELANRIASDNDELDGNDNEDASPLIHQDERGPIRFVVSVAVGAANHFKLRGVEEAKSEPSLDMCTVQGEASSDYTDGLMERGNFPPAVQPSAAQTSEVANDSTSDNDYTYSTNEGPIDRVVNAAIEVANHFKRRLEAERETVVCNKSTVDVNEISTPDVERSSFKDDSTLRGGISKDRQDERGTNCNDEMKCDLDETQVAFIEPDGIDDAQDIRENSFIAAIRHHAQFQRVLAQLELSEIDNPIMLELDDAKVKKHHHLRDRVSKSANTNYADEKKESISFNYVVYHEVPTAEYVDDGTLFHFLMRTRRRRRIFLEA